MATVEQRRRRLTSVPGLNSSRGWLTMSPAQRTRHLFRFQSITGMALEALTQFCVSGRDEDSSLVVVRSVGEIVSGLVDCALSIEDFSQRCVSVCARVFFFLMVLGVHWTEFLSLGLPCTAWPMLGRLLSRGSAMWASSVQPVFSWHSSWTTVSTASSSATVARSRGCPFLSESVPFPAASSLEVFRHPLSFIFVAHLFECRLLKGSKTI